MTSDADAKVRLNKHLAQNLSIGRRQADHYIERGRVMVNGEQAVLGSRIDPMVDIITVDDIIVNTHKSEDLTYIAFNKPVGYICSRKQQGDAPTIYSLLPEGLHHLKPVGRLDKDSSGLILLTNDGDFTHQQTHPSFIKIKRYEISLDKPLEPLHRQMIVEHGIDLPDGKSQFMLERIEEDNDKQWVVTMHEGKNRQIRRTFAALNYTINRLHRIQFGNHSINGLKSGELQRLRINTAK